MTARVKHSHATELAKLQAAHTRTHSPKIGWSGSLAWSSFRVCAKHWKAIRECLDAAACTAACCAGVVAACSTTCAALTRGTATTIFGGSPGLGCFAWAARSLKNLAGSERDTSHSVAVNSRSFGHPGGKECKNVCSVVSASGWSSVAAQPAHSQFVCCRLAGKACWAVLCLTPHLLLQLP